MRVVKKGFNGRGVGKEKMALMGNPFLNGIETYNVENYNSILRNFLSRLVRKGKGFTKKKRRDYTTLSPYSSSSGTSYTN
ncbi:hypothetical protein Mtc_2304 [Methanocella conradii HZ254]|uniref:Uncharacterized protein n=1 Tax=Methanocella conradii (strain DSM 24694 / JCM 17849 / CGMCC 1.5162 / HZ254) TaxID=1041930 RepID=H8IB29_METCZ|nr:IS1 transposase [Methanocella conradii]AFD01039.1 hypothetical protein Mtc_2304 [Methanocella conradii HZ254]